MRSFINHIQERVKVQDLNSHLILQALEQQQQLSQGEEEEGAQRAKPTF
jgi:hypothetical protein